MIHLIINRPNYCNICQKSFSSPINLTNHNLAIHEQIFPFKCDYPGCHKKYSTENRLKFHKKIHFNNKPFLCDICDKSFISRADLRIHIQFHREDRPFKCSLCSKAYKTNEHLKEHFQIKHLGIKNYHCNYCSKSFGKSSALKAHIKTHTGEKPFKCFISSCMKHFAEKGNMIIHYKRHLKRIEKKEKQITQHIFDNESLIHKHSQTDSTISSSEENEPMKTNNNEKDKIITCGCSEETKEEEINVQDGNLFNTYLSNNFDLFFIENE